MIDSCITVSFREYVSLCYSTRVIGSRSSSIGRKILNPENESLGSTYPHSYSPYNLPAHLDFFIEKNYKSKERTPFLEKVYEGEDHAPLYDSALWSWVYDHRSAFDQAGPDSGLMRYTSTTIDSRNHFYEPESIPIRDKYITLFKKVTFYPRGGRRSYIRHILWGIYYSSPNGDKLTVIPSSQPEDCDDEPLNRLSDNDLQKPSSAGDNLMTLEEWVDYHFLLTDSILPVERLKQIKTALNNNRTDEIKHLAWLKATDENLPFPESRDGVVTNSRRYVENNNREVEFRSTWIPDKKARQITLYLCDYKNCMRNMAEQINLIFENLEKTEEEIFNNMKSKHKADFEGLETDENGDVLHLYHKTVLTALINRENAGILKKPDSFIQHIREPFHDPLWQSYCESAWRRGLLNMTAYLFWRLLWLEDHYLMAVSMDAYYLGKQSSDSAENPLSEIRKMKADMAATVHLSDVRSHMVDNEIVAEIREDLEALKNTINFKTYTDQTAKSFPTFQAEDLYEAAFDAELPMPVRVKPLFDIFLPIADEALDASSVESLLTLVQPFTGIIVGDLPQRHFPLALKNSMNTDSVKALVKVTSASVDVAFALIDLRDNPGVESYLSAGSVLFSLAQEVIEYQSKVAMDELLTKAARSLSQGTTRGGGIAYIRALLTQKQTFARGAQYLGLKALSVGASYLGIAASVIQGTRLIQEGDSDAGTMVLISSVFGILGATIGGPVCFAVGLAAGIMGALMTNDDYENWLRYSFYGTDSLLGTEPEHLPENKPVWAHYPDWIYSIAPHVYDYYLIPQVDSSLTGQSRHKRANYTDMMLDIAWLDRAAKPEGEAFRDIETCEGIDITLRLPVFLKENRFFLFLTMERGYYNKMYEDGNREIQNNIFSVVDLDEPIVLLSKEIIPDKKNCESIGNPFVLTERIVLKELNSTKKNAINEWKKWNALYPDFSPSQTLLGPQYRHETRTPNEVIAFDMTASLYVCSDPASVYNLTQKDSEISPFISELAMKNQELLSHIGLSFQHKLYFSTVLDAPLPVPDRGEAPIIKLFNAIRMRFSDN